jgi:hypothetical protein
LPVTLVTLKAYLLPSGNGEILWETETESNCKEFEVQHSTDSVNWKSIGIVTGSGDSVTLKRYTLQHNGLVVGRNFYRLWQVDFNGSRRMYGPVILQVKENAALVVKSYPNPASFDFNITVTASKTQTAMIQFFDIQGHLLVKQPVKISSGFNKFNYLTSQFRGYKGELIIHLVTDMNMQRTIKQIIQ